MKPVCLFCGKPCEPADKTADGYYAHHQCLRIHSIHPVARGDKGGNLYQGDT